jgi:hypothetical protein
MTFNGETLSAESLSTAREWYAVHHETCAAEALQGAFAVSDLPSYLASCASMASECREGVYDYTFALRQRAYYLQTGKSVAFLP